MSEPAAVIDVEVEVDPALIDASNLRGWVEEDARKALDALPVEPRREGVIRVGIGGELYDYQVTVTALRDGEVLGTPSAWGCECSSGELLQRLREELPRVASALEVEEELEEPAVDPTPAPVAPVTDDRRKRKRLGPAGSSGVALMSMGAAATAAGVTLMILRETPPGDPNAMTLEFRDLRPAGGVVAGAGVGLLATGLTMYLLRGRRSERAQMSALAPSIDEHGRVAVAVMGRF